MEMASTKHKKVAAYLVNLKAEFHYLRNTCIHTHTHI